jgi:ribose 5-phosphate isomerase B
MGKGEGERASMKLAIGSDHAGLALKRELRRALDERQLAVEDFGTHTDDSVDYPDFAARVGQAVSLGDCAMGVLVCGTGIGMSIAANKVRGVRAAVCTTEFEARMARAHNDANVLCLGSRVVGGGLANEIVAAFLDQKFEAGRHERRVQKIRDAEMQNER